MLRNSLNGMRPLYIAILTKTWYVASYYTLVEEFFPQESLFLFFIRGSFFKKIESLDEENHEITC